MGLYGLIDRQRKGAIRFRNQLGIEQECYLGEENPADLGLRCRSPDGEGDQERADKKRR